MLEGAYTLRGQDLDTEVPQGMSGRLGGGTAQSLGGCCSGPGPPALHPQARQGAESTGCWEGAGGRSLPLVDELLQGSAL